MVLFVQHPEQILNLNNVCAYSLAKYLDFFILLLLTIKSQTIKHYIIIYFFKHHISVRVLSHGTVIVFQS